jgi:hypothetical protein
MNILRLSLSFTFLVLSSAGLLATAQSNKDVAWTIRIPVRVTFLPSAYSRLHIDLIYPASENVELVQEAIRLRWRAEVDQAWEYESEVIVRPKNFSEKRPTHVHFAVSAFGFKKQTVNTGILKYVAQNNMLTATMPVSFKLEPDDLPKIQNIINVVSQPNEAAFDLSIVNPTQFEAVISALRLEFGNMRFAHCLDAHERRYSISLNIDGTHVKGFLRGDTFQYKVRGDVITGCPRDYFISTSTPLNLSIPSTGIATVQLNIRAPSNLLETIRRRYGKVTWRFYFTINNELHILSTTNN